MLQVTRVLALVTALAAVLALRPAPADAVPLGTFTGSSGALSASASFDLTGDVLTVTLTNTSTADVVSTGQLLTAVFFGLSPSQTLSPDTAVLGAGSGVVGGAPSSGNLTDPGNSVGGEWAYATGSSIVVPGADQIISSVGDPLDLFLPSPQIAFPGSDLDAPTSPDGGNYGITSFGDNFATGNTGLQNDPYIHYQVVFTLSGVAAGSTISNVYFNYGTGVKIVPSVPAPEPASLLLLGAGLVALGIWGRRKFGSTRA